jgi:uncharacterized protein with GYD domain
MPKYLIQGSYTAKGLEGLLKDGGSGRVNAVRELLKEVGGTLEAFYFTFGDDDFCIILEVPSDVDMTSIALDAQATGEVESRVTVLIPPEDVDKAVKHRLKFRAPGK